MITTVLKSFAGTTQSLLQSPRALAVFAGLYALLLASLGGFIRIHEATVWQVTVTFILLVLVPAEFFVLQSAVVTHAQQSKFQWGRILRVAFKLALVTIPIILIGYALFLLLNKWKAHYPAPAPVLVFDTPHGPPRPQPTHWPTVLFATLRGLLFGVALPLATIHFWLALAAHSFQEVFSGGAKPVLRRLGNVSARAFASDSVLTYALGLIVFVVLPYAVLFVHISPKGTKTDFAVFVARIMLAFAFTLVGWIATIGTLARIGDQEAPAVAREAIAAEAPA